MVFSSEYRYKPLPAAKTGVKSATKARESQEIIMRVLSICFERGREIKRDNLHSFTYNFTNLNLADTLKSRPRRERYLQTIEEITKLHRIIEKVKGPVIGPLDNNYILCKDGFELIVKNIEEIEEL